MFPDSGEPPREDPSVAFVEAILEAASGSVEEAAHRQGRIAATHALWLCACETADASPIWLIYAVGDNGVRWQKIEGGEQEVSDVVQAEHLAGDHPAPRGVLAWLRGDQPYPRRGNRLYPEDDYIYDELLRRIRRN